VVRPEIKSWHDVNPEATLRVIEENRDIIRGVKLRANGTLVEKLGIEAEIRNIPVISLGAI